MRAIANRVGITAGALYWYFPSKADLAVEFLEGVLEALMDASKRATTGSSWGEKLCQAVRAHIMFNFEQSESNKTYNALFGAAHIPELVRNIPGSRIVDLQRKYVDIFKGILRNGVRAGEFRAVEVTPTAFAIINMCDYVSAWYSPNGRLSQGEVASLHADLALSMVKAHARRNRH